LAVPTKSVPPTILGVPVIVSDAETDDRGEQYEGK
jgi:hypothetical protein